MKYWTFTKFLFALALFAPPYWALAASGELWETQSVMESQAHGPMNLGSSRQCRATTWRLKPEFRAPGDSGECKSQQLRQQDHGYAWTFDCKGTKGEATARLVGTDRVEGTMRMDSPQGRFTLKFSSRKVGNCDTSERER